MLSRAVQRAAQRRTLPARLPAPIASIQALRAYSSGSDGKPPKPPQRPPPPSSKSFSPATGAARQTSPGTSFPKDKTWQPKDGITFGGPAAGTASGAGLQGSGGAASTGGKSAATPVDGSRPEVPSAMPPPDLLQDSAAPHEPLAQQADIDAPPAGSIRDETQSKQAAAENAPAPPDASGAADQPFEASQQNQKPLPDLRFGIPSTLDFELNQRRGAVAEEAGQEEKLGVTSARPEAQERGEREDRERDGSAYETSIDRRRARLANYLYGSMLAGAVGAGLFLSRPFGSDEPLPAGLALEDATGWAPGKLYTRVRARFGSQLGYYTEPAFPKLLPEVPASQRPPLTLVLSLEDLLIHSSWDREHGYRTAKRPGVDYAIRYLSQYYEIVMFTSVPIGMADPVLRKLDPYHFIMWPLGREATKYEGGEYIKDLAYLNRPLDKTLIIDTHAPHVRNQPENAIILPKWKGDPKDPHAKDLVALIPFLEYIATMGIEDVRKVLKSFEGTSIPEEFARREAEARAQFNAQLAEQRRRRPAFSVGSLAGGLGLKGGAAAGAGGGMVLADGQSVADGLAQGKMLSDQFREQGQRQYEFLEKQIRENGAQWLKEEEEAQKKAMEDQMREAKKGGAFGWFGGAK